MPRQHHSAEVQMRMALFAGPLAAVLALSGAVVGDMLPSSPGASHLGPSRPQFDPCESTRYEAATYRGHAETPWIGDIDGMQASAVVEWIADSLCFADVALGDPSKSGRFHALYVAGEAVAQFEAAVIPERRAFNVSRGDLREGPRIIARVVMRRTAANTTTDNFLPRQYKVGTNYLMLSDDDLGTHLRIVYTDGSLSDEIPDAGMLTDHGHFPRDRRKVVPAFSDGLGECTKAKDRSACFVDDPSSHVLEPVWRNVGGFRMRALPMLANNTTSTWVKLNGICYCQGENCH